MGWRQTMRNNQTRFSYLQDKYFLKADMRKFRWMTQNPYFSLKEKELLALLNQLRPSRLLEVGTGEAGNLVNLEHRPKLAVGIDLYVDRCRFAREHCSTATFVCGNAYQLPFQSAVFDLVFCRDLLHHVVDGKSLVTEMARTCRPGGHVVCIEACGRNPVIFCLAVALRAERGLLRSNVKVLQSMLLEAGLADVNARMYQPLPTYRMLLHPRFGFPSLGEREWYRCWADRFDRLTARVVPQRWWGYTVVSGRKLATV